ncbi:DNA-3-methyladenine glycosylase family protein [Algicella marina]|uniref:DNA-3-methyladenine glycosylase II n=1 Tax=Algicella marina TaxID=2683284 RepID=A0A6P1T3K2_9RHOB|nr:DNA-3-methyladenine glycosylase 2 family protein [Algicella marina]QHQ35092.1 DNA-3-methyladenine glycosylase 2 family protein [Algicella marina]
MVGRILTCQDDVEEGLAWLAAADPALARAIAVAGPVDLRRREGGFPALLSAIVSQQVSVASASAIWSRLEAAGLTDMQAVAAASEEALTACGLSRQKRRYARALAESGIAFDALAQAPDEEIIATLTSVTGIGVWTAEIYAKFSLGRADIFAAGDLALQEAARMIYDMDERPTEKALRTQSLAWSPWRSVAATLFWKYYGVQKAREGVRV